MVNPPSYVNIVERLVYVERLANLLHIAQELTGETPAIDAGDVDAMVAFLANVIELLGRRFPICEPFIVYEMATPAGITEIELRDLVYFQGLDYERGWDEWLAAFQLVLAITHAGDDFWYFGPYDRHVLEWWKIYMDDFDLPPLGELSFFEMRGRLEHLPEPWSGLWAILRWIEADTGYVFADIPVVYERQADGYYDTTWNWSSVEMLTEDYKAADREIFSPAWKLARLCEQDDNAVLRTCFDLVLGRVEAQNAPVPLVLAEGESDG